MMIPYQKIAPVKHQQLLIFFLKTFCTLCILMSSGCIFTESDDIIVHKNRTQNPYVINGLSYYPHQNYEFCEIVLASYYGNDDGFHGKLTANGDQFDKNLITGAHKTFPIPCIVEVTDLTTKNCITVLINDRGPFVKNRDLDLSYAAARSLGGDILKKGVALVRVRILKRETKKMIEKRKSRR